MILIKNDKQIRGIKKSCNLASRTLDFIEPFVQAGVTTGELNCKIEKFIRDHGAVPATLNYPSHDGHIYPAASCISLNEVVCHGIPSDEALKEGDILNIDVTTIVYGYFGDTARMFTVGQVSPAAQRLLDIAKQCLQVGIEQVVPGNRFGRIGWAISNLAENAGYSVVYQFCGHGVGVKFHEEPSISHKSTPDFGLIMRPGMIFTIEPMINEGCPETIIDEQDHWTAKTADNKLSAQYEHTILVTPTGHEILTNSTIR